MQQTSDKTCQVSGCTWRAFLKGLCTKHYRSKIPTTASSTDKPILPPEKQATPSTASTPQISTSPPLRLITSTKSMSPSPLSPSRRSPTSPSYRYQVDSSQAPSPSSRTRRRSFLLGGAASTSGSSSTPQKTLRCTYRGGCISPCFLRNLCPKHYTQSLREGRSSAVIAEGPRIASPAPSPNRRGSFKKPEHPIDGLVVAPTRGLLQIGRAVQQECRDRSRMPSSA
eukprot:TRINITY_DN18560_c0_g1_i10.p1 TRINITY_DN18560_c0_g1~~TRINITY_DN18560_c0_g1_i10.p1  ORF type:complete len:226 (+),score=9.15 TRINITY_DN18560_c0_g1_i10:122-799(+)